MRVTLLAYDSEAEYVKRDLIAKWLYPTRQYSKLTVKRDE
jgi:hypothetical protein